MKKIITLVVFLIASQTLFGQFYDKGWGLGFGVSSIRYTGDVQAEKLNFGGHLFVQNDLNARHGFRARLDYGAFSTTDAIGISTDNFALGLEYLMKFHHCSPISPYFGAGFALLFYSVDGSNIGKLDDLRTGELGANIFFGALFDFIGDDWKMRGEFRQTTVTTDDFDGIYGDNGGFFGGTLDSYISFDLGVFYYFDKGEPYSDCEGDGAGGIRKSDLELIQKKYAESTKEDLNGIKDEIRSLKMEMANLEKKMVAQPAEQGNIKDALDEYFMKKYQGDFKTLYFKKNSINLEFSSMADLVKAGDILTHNTDIDVAITGYTDDSGNAGFNNALSKRRAEFVKNYLVARGVSASRISVKGMGEKNPANSNDTEEGRKLNRRVEFKIMN